MARWAVFKLPTDDRGIKFSKNSVFMKSNYAKIENLKQLGKQNTQHKPAITTNDFKKLKVHPVISHDSSWPLRKVMFGSTQSYIWCRRDREGQRNLSPSSFTFAIEENSREYATMTHDELSKIIPVDLTTWKVLKKTAECTVLQMTSATATMPWSFIFLS